MHQVARPQGLGDRPTVIGGLHACSDFRQPPSQNQQETSTSRAQVMLAEQHLLTSASVQSGNVGGIFEEQREVEVAFDGQQPGRSPSAATAYSASNRANMGGPLPGVPQCGKLVQCDRPSLRLGQAARERVFGLLPPLSRSAAIQNYCANLNPRVLDVDQVGGPNGIRTRATSLKGWRPRPLDDRADRISAYTATSVWAADRCGCRSAG